MADDLSHPFDRLGPAEPATPLVVAVPHAGRLYPAAMERARAVPHLVLEELEDRHADLLIAEAVAGGAVAIVARIARAVIDLNRGEEDGTPGPGTSGSARERAGLGLIPRRLGRRDLWSDPPGPLEIARRLAAVHAPYHRQLATALAAARARHGYALLVDCHSMPPLHRGRLAARVVLGDRHGAAAVAGVATAAAGVAAQHGVPVARNAPYAGAYTLRRHGAPADGIHALQIEMDRTLYLDAALREPGKGLSACTALFAEMAWAATAAVADGGTALAAE